eukprot:303604-Pleurochrysis_carterae.AAC.2
MVTDRAADIELPALPSHDAGVNASSCDRVCVRTQRAPTRPGYRTSAPWSRVRGENLPSGVLCPRDFRLRDRSPARAGSLPGLDIRDVEFSRNGRYIINLATAHLQRCAIKPYCKLGFAQAPAGGSWIHLGAGFLPLLALRCFFGAGVWRRGAGQSQCPVCG